MTTTKNILLHPGDLLERKGIILPERIKKKMRCGRRESIYKQQEKDRTEEEKKRKKEELPFPSFMKNTVFGEQFLISAPYYGVATLIESSVKHGKYSFDFVTVYTDPFREMINRGSRSTFVTRQEKEILVNDHGLKIICKLNGQFNFQKMYELHAISVILSNFTDCLDRPQADVEMNGFFSHIRPEILGVLEKKRKLAKEAIERLSERDRNCSWERQASDWKSFASVNWKEELQNCGLDLSEYFQIIEMKP